MCWAACRARFRMEDGNAPINTSALAIVDRAINLDPTL
jgi:hypothetical protein